MLGYAQIEIRVHTSFKQAVQPCSYERCKAYCDISGIPHSFSIKGSTVWKHKIQYILHFYIVMCLDDCLIFTHCMPLTYTVDSTWQCLVQTKTSPVNNCKILIYFSNLPGRTYTMEECKLDLWRVIKIKLSLMVAATYIYIEREYMWKGGNWS